MWIVGCCANDWQGCYHNPARHWTEYRIPKLMAPMFGQMITDMAPGSKKANGCIITTTTGYIHTQFLPIEKKNFPKMKVIGFLSDDSDPSETIPTLVWAGLVSNWPISSAGLMTASWPWAPPRPPCLPCLPFNRHLPAWDISGLMMISSGTKWHWKMA